MNGLCIWRDGKHKFKLMNQPQLSKLCLWRSWAVFEILKNDRNLLTDWRRDKEWNMTTIKIKAEWKVIILFLAIDWLLILLISVIIPNFWRQ